MTTQFDFEQSLKIRDALARLISAAPTPKYEDKVGFAKAQKVAEYLIEAGVIDLTAVEDLVYAEISEQEQKRKEKT